MTLGIVQARLGSSRLPRKMLRPLAGRPALEHTLERARAARGIDRLVVATTDLPIDDPLAQFAEELGVEVFRGHPNDVLDRYYQAAKALGASADETIVRLTGDCPMHDPAVIDRVIGEYERARRAGAPGVEYASNISPPSFPSGLDVEAFSFPALEAAWREATRDFEREHVTLYIRDHPERFPALNVSCPEGDLSGLRWTLDVEADAAVLDSLLSLGRAQEAAEFSYRDGLRAIERNSSLAQMNAGVGRNTPVVEAILRDALRESIRKPQAKSRAICSKAEGLLAPPVPIASFEQPGRVAARAIGCRVWDVDGNEHVDFRMGNGTAAFGYGVPPSELADANPAGGIGRQVALASRLLGQFHLQGRAAFFSSLTETLAAAAAGAVRKTGRRRIVLYGAPLFEAEIRGNESLNGGRRDELFLEFSSLPSNGGSVPVGPVAESAAVVVEPLAEYSCFARVPVGVAELCAEMGTLLIVNATPSLLGGCRLDLGELPAGLHIAVVIGSGLANGMPFAALLGAPDLFGGRLRAQPGEASRSSAMAIAAALENLGKLDSSAERERVSTLAAKLWHGLEAITNDFRLFGYCDLVYRPPHVVFRFRDSDLFRGTSMQFLFDRL
jgi:spore coat polysaccharide biosynthesis protein SpsF (cytidylyltransferase family)